MPGQTMTKEKITFYVEPDKEPVMQPQSQSLTVNSETPTTAVAVASTPTSPNWVSFPATCDHGVPFSFTLTPTTMSRIIGTNRGFRAGSILQTITMTFTKATYATVGLTVELVARGGFNPAGHGG